jgi:C-terminal processing protease CtpA/Prc
MSRRHATIDICAQPDYRLNITQRVLNNLKDRLMKTMVRRFLVALVVVAALAPAALPMQAASPSRQAASGPHTITGSYRTTNPIYPLLGARPSVVLYDMTGQILKDFDFRSPPQAQVLGTLSGDIVSGTYTLTLPDAPQGTLLDFDGNAATPSAVQAFVTTTYIDLFGDAYIDRGETDAMLGMSARLDPLSYDVIGGEILVWSAKEGELFPGGMGPDGAAFTADDPLIALPAGWSAISLETDPFTVRRDATVDIPVLENAGKLHDYSALSYVDAWNELFQRTQETYPFTDYKHLDWNAIYDEITPQVKAATSDLEFHLAIIHFGESIPDTHIEYVSIPVLQAYLFGGVGISKLVVTDDNALVVAGVAPGTPAAQAGIQVGYTLVTVDGKPALQALDDTPLLLSSASTPQVRRYFQAVTMLQGPVGSRVTLAWRDANGVEQSQTFTRTMEVSSILQTGGGLPSGDVITSRMLDSGVGYIRVSNFYQDAGQADKLFGDQLQALIDTGAKGIIIDVRDNSGGLTALGMAMTGHFFPDYKQLLDLYYADREGEFAYRGQMEILAEKPYYDGPVAILVNEMTVSMGDLFAYAMQANHRALIVGNTPSSGSVGEIGDGQYLLPGGLQMQIPTGRPVDPVTDEVVVEGKGVIPDIRVPLTVQSVVSPQDEVLQAAEAAIVERQP